MAKLDGTPVLTITRMKGTSAMAGLMGSPSSANQDSTDRRALARVPQSLGS